MTQIGIPAHTRVEGNGSVLPVPLRSLNGKIVQEKREEIRNEKRNNQEVSIQSLQQTKIEGKGPTPLRTLNVKENQGEEEIHNEKLGNVPLPQTNALQTDSHVLVEVNGPTDTGPLLTLDGKENQEEKEVTTQHPKDKKRNHEDIVTTKTYSQKRKTGTLTPTKKPLPISRKTRARSIPTEYVHKPQRSKKVTVQTELYVCVFCAAEMEDCKAGCISGKTHLDQCRSTRFYVYKDGVCCEHCFPGGRRGKCGSCGKTKRVWKYGNENLCSYCYKCDAVTM